MQKSVLSPAMIVHPRQAPIAEWRDQLVPLVTSARDALHRLSGVWLEVESIPRVISVAHPTPATFQAEWKRIHRAMRGEDHTLLVAFSVGVASRDENFDGWGGGRGGSGQAVLHTDALNAWRRLALAPIQAASDPAIADAALRQEWLVVHEMCHMLELPHACKDPRAEECAENVMGYTAEMYAQWKSGGRAEYGFNVDQRERLRALDYVEVREDTMPDDQQFEITVADGSNPLYPKPREETRRARPNGPNDIGQIQIHSTRGNAPTDMQVSATVNHFASEANVQFPPWHIAAGQLRGWGGSADFVVGRDARVEGSPVVIVQLGDWENTWSRFSAGYGFEGWRTEYPAAEVGVAIEIAQRHPNDEFEVDVIRAVAWLCKHINRRLIELGLVGISDRRIMSWDQARDAPIPYGYIGHEDLANGQRLGKSDPGPEFPWSTLLALVSGEGPELEANEQLRANATNEMVDTMAEGLIHVVRSATAFREAALAYLSAVDKIADTLMEQVEKFEELLDEIRRINTEGV